MSGGDDIEVDDQPKEGRTDGLVVPWKNSCIGLKMLVGARQDFLELEIVSVHWRPQLIEYLPSLLASRTTVLVYSSRIDK